MVEMIRRFKIKSLGYIGVVFLGLLPFLGEAAEVKMESVLLMQPDVVYQESGVSAKELSEVIRRTVEETGKVWEEENMPASSGYIVLALRSDGEIKAWLDMEAELTEAVENKAVLQVQDIEGVQFAEGILVLAVQISVNEGGGVLERKPAPKAWLEALASFSEPVDAQTLVKHLWSE